MINYIILFVGIVILIISVVLIIFDRIKAEEIFFDIDIKEKQLKSIIKDAEEIITELNYTSYSIVKELEDRVDDLDKGIKTNISKNNELKEYEVERNCTNKPVFNISTSKYNKIFKYADEGLNIVEIAKLMDMGQGEIQLILSLKKENINYE